MASNNRIFYAVQSVAITPRGTDPITAAHIVHGLQSVGMSSTFTLDQVFEMGQIEIYENIEEVADIEVTLEKVIDGYKLIYDLATAGECKTSIVSASKQRSDCYLAVFDDGQDHATGIPQTVCMNSGMYVSSVSYSYSIDGSATESVTLVGNDRFWNTSTTTKNPSAVWTSNPSTNIDGTDTPLSGVVRRTDILLGAGGSTLPSEVNLNEGSDPIGNSSNRHVQSISVSTDFGQENIQELGRFGPYFRFATFPVEVTAEFEVVSASGDMISVSGSAPNLTNSTIIIKDNAGTVLDLGTSNKLSSVSYSGGDTGGGNATVSYSYSNFNVLTVNGGNTHA
jgi:hypothetical protein|tara:strand:+ start:2057 stop:3070 length:1014 start_codon:yes stop_codon:yes gene_type:complete